jgi:hypothetical protein
VSEVNESELGLSFAKPALADHLMRRDPDAELVWFRIVQFLVGRLRLPFAFPEKLDEGVHKNRAAGRGRKESAQKVAPAVDPPRDEASENVA